MAGSKRERDLHRAKVARQQKEEAAAAERRRKRLQIGAAIAGTALVLAVILGVAVAVGGSDDDSPSAAAPNASSTATVAPEDKTKASNVSCAGVTSRKSNNKQSTLEEATAAPLKDKGTYTEALDTNCGDIEIDLDENAPNTVKAITYLSDNAEFYNNSTCHRLTTTGIYVLQCGDPEGTGSGGPGFRMAEENLPEGDPNSQVIYPRGTVAMAKTAEPGSTGSQFFLVYKDSPLTPTYTVIGKITKGMEILDHIAAKGVEGGGADGKPVQPLQINKMVSSVTTPFNPDSNS